MAQNADKSLGEAFTVTPQEKTVRRTFTWLKSHQTRLIFGLRMTLSAIGSFIIAEALDLAPAWAVLSAIITIQSNAGGSLNAAYVRLLGTIGGALWGAAVAIILRDHPERSLLALTLMLAPMAIFVGYVPAYRVAPVTGAIVLLGLGDGQAGPVQTAIFRMVEIALGSGVAIAVVLFILPAHASRGLSRAASTALKTMAELVQHFSQNADERWSFTVLKLNDAMNASIFKVDAMSKEAALELTTRLADGPNPEPMVRTLRRLRHDLALLGRIVFNVGKSQGGDDIVVKKRAVLCAIVRYMLDTAQALNARAPAPTLSEVDEALMAFHASLNAPHYEERAQHLTPKERGEMFALAFLFDQVKKNLTDLADRTNELAKDTGSSS